MPSLPARLVRLRLLDGSSARIHRLAYVDSIGARPFDAEGGTERRFTLDHRGLQWQINGLEYDMR